MRDFHAFRDTAIRTGSVAALSTIWCSCPHETHYSYVLPLFALSALGANICYSFAYALEFLFGSDDAASRWMRYGRTTAFVTGLYLLCFSRLLAGGTLRSNLCKMPTSFDSLNDGNMAELLSLEYPGGFAKLRRRKSLKWTLAGGKGKS